jgi:hypothetical protein
MFYDMSDLDGSDSGLRSSLNHESHKLVASQSKITCPVHNWCNGTCQASGGTAPITFEPLLGDGLIFEVSPPETSLSEPSLVTEPWTVVEFELEEFEYKSLDPETATIRLILVEPQGFLDDPVIIELIELSPDSPISYAAISYRWGPPIFDHKIICNGKLLRITGALHGALKLHRQQKHNKPQFLWADAICINQSDESEVNQQIHLMNEIFSEVEIVYVDLGDVGTDCTKGLAS